MLYQQVEIMFGELVWCLDKPSPGFIRVSIIATEREELAKEYLLSGHPLQKLRG